MVSNKIEQGLTSSIAEDDPHKVSKQLQIKQWTHENNEFFPREHIQQGRDKFAAQQRVISKEFEGPSL